MDDDAGANIVCIGSRAARHQRPAHLGLRGQGDDGRQSSHWRSKWRTSGIRANVVSPGDIIFPGGVWDGARTDGGKLWEATVKREPVPAASQHRNHDVVAFLVSRQTVTGITSWSTVARRPAYYLCVRPAHPLLRSSCSDAEFIQNRLAARTRPIGERRGRGERHSRHSAPRCDGCRACVGVVTLSSLIAAVNDDNRYESYLLSLPEQLSASHHAPAGRRLFHRGRR
jgi:hypothetical protein